MDFLTHIVSAFDKDMHALNLRKQTTPITQHRPYIPPAAVSIYNPNFEYTAAAQTDVTRTWKKYGWEQPDKCRQARVKLLLNRVSCLEDMYELTDRLGRQSCYEMG